MNQTAGALLGSGRWVRESETSRRIGRGYFAVQAIAGAVWWISVFTVPAVRRATLGDIDPVLMAVADLPLFAVASALVALGARWAAWIAVPWTLLVAGAMIVVATLTGTAGWGALLMGAAGIGSVLAWLLLRFGRIPADAALAGPLGFGTAQRGVPPIRQLLRTLLQMTVFWILFLGVIPFGIALAEWRWGLRVEFPDGVRAVGLGILLLASALGVWAAFAMALRGDGTPLPSAAANRLVIVGPYRFVRNPMALAGIVQAFGVGLAGSSWLVAVYALCGILYWNELVRPFEEDDLSDRFGAEFEAYRDRVRCWVPGAPAPRSRIAG